MTSTKRFAETEEQFDYTIIADQIRAAKAKLTPETWHKGSYFAARGSTVCMCAHGAMQSTSNPGVIRALITHSQKPASAAAAEVFAGKAAAAESAEAAAPEAEATAAIAAGLAAAAGTGHKPSWVGPKDGTEQSYVLGLAGLTAGFNDAKDTTLDMVHAKFDRAAEIAEKLWPKPEPKAKKAPRPLVPGTKRWLAAKYRQAARLLEEKGWCQGRFDGSNGSHCAVGAIKSVSDGPYYYYRERDFEDAIVRIINNDRHGLISFNDEPGRTKEEVVRVLRGVAYMLDHGGRMPPWATREKAGKGEEAAQ